MIIGNFIKQIELKYKNHYFSGISFNSSKCKRDNIFFAIKGTKIDGNKFINHAIKKGAKTIISNHKFEGVRKNILYIKSLNTRKLLSIKVKKVINPNVSVIKKINPIKIFFLIKSVIMR